MPPAASHEIPNPWYDGRMDIPKCTALALAALLTLACVGLGGVLTPAQGNTRGSVTGETTATTALLPTHTPTPAPTQTSFPTASPAPTGIPALRWENIANAAFPNEWAEGGVVQLQDGFLSQPHPNQDGQVAFQLSQLRLFADLDADGLQDALTFLLVDRGGQGTLVYLYALRNRAGLPLAAEPYRLGKDIFLRDLRAEAGLVTLIMDTLGPGDSACCPRDTRQYTLRLEEDALVLQDELDLPNPAVNGRTDGLPRRLEPVRGAAPQHIEGQVDFNRLTAYRVYALAGETLTVSIESPGQDVYFSIFGEDGGQMLASYNEETRTWSGRLPASQDYLVQVVPVSAATTYTLSLNIDPLPGAADEPEPGWVPQPEEPKVLYLTFDDGPSEWWTPRILEVLARYDAHATFFALGEQVDASPEMAAAVLAAGHSIGNHSLTHQTFEGVTRTGFLRELLGTQTQLEGQGSACLRPPYGAIDANTRVYAAEQGYRVVLWDVDPQDWRRPGVTEIAAGVIDRVKPGDVILLHDGGGERSQTVLALEIILRTLGEQGYTFESICR